MNRLPLLALSLVGLLALGGCQPQAVGANGTMGANSATGRASATPPKPAAPKAPVASLDALPANLRNDAFAYYGLGRARPITMTITSGGDAKTGNQDVRVLEVTPAQARFEIISTDGLSIMGRNVVGLRADGIHVLESDVTKTNPDEFELPADLSPGKTWSVTQSLDDGARTMKIVLVQRVVGPQALKTKVGEYPDALLVTGTGTGTLQGKPVRMETKSWFVKGRGNVKYTIATTTNGKTDTTVVEETP